MAIQEDIDLGNGLNQKKTSLIKSVIAGNRFMDVNDIFPWLNNNSTFLLVVATFVLAFVSYLQVRASYKAISESRHIRNIDKHTEQLKTLIIQWQMDLPRPPKTGLEVSDYYDAIFEKDKLFPDIANHLPPEHKELMEKWEHYKDLRKKYYKKQTEIIDKIAGLISNMQKENEDYDFPPRSVYLKAIELLTGKKYYDYKREEKVHAEPTFYRLFYETIYSGNRFQLNRESSRLTDEEINKIQERHENVSNIVKNEYEKDIENLINIEGEINENFKELNDKLMELTKYTEYYNMNCKYIPRF